MERLREIYILFSTNYDDAEKTKLERRQHSRPEVLIQEALEKQIENDELHKELKRIF